MTQMSDSRLLELIQSGAEALNEQLGLGLDDVMRTGGERRHTKRMKVAGNGQKMERNENDFSFSYSDATFHEEVPTC